VPNIELVVFGRSYISFGEKVAGKIEVKQVFFAKNKMTLKLSMRGKTYTTQPEYTCSISVFAVFQFSCLIS